MRRDILTYDDHDGSFVFFDQIERVTYVPTLNPYVQSRIFLVNGSYVDSPLKVENIKSRICNINVRNVT